MLVAPTGGSLLVGLLIACGGGGLLIASAYLAARRPQLRDVAQAVAELVLAFGMAIVIAYIWWLVEGASGAARAIGSRPSPAAQQAFTSLMWIGVLQWLFASLGALFIFLAVGDLYRASSVTAGQRTHPSVFEIAMGILLLLLTIIVGYFAWILATAIALSAAH